MDTIESLLKEYTAKVTRVAEEACVQRMLASVGAKSVALTGGKTKRKGPIQLCPVPGCRVPAAPVYRMLCRKHKDTPKAKVAQYREQRRKAKAKIRASKSH